jgi:predicted permease
VGTLEVLETVVPVFVLVAVGVVLGRRRRPDLASLTDLVVYLGGPALVFSSLMRGDLAAGELAVLVSGVLWIVLGVGMAVVVAAAVSGRRPGALYLPMMFMNAGNMLLPLSLFAFGEAGLDRAVVIFATMTVLQSTLGVAIASGRGRLLEPLRLPYVWVVAAAGLLGASGVELPELVMRPIGLLADLAVPLMLLALGVRLEAVRVGSWWRPLGSSVVRIAGGYAAARLFVFVSGVEGIERQCLLLASVMPSAVINFVFAEKYGNESGDVAAAVFASTVLSVATTPLVLAVGI